MISNWLSAALARRNIHYGWVMVGVTFLTALIAAGTVGAPGVFIVPLQADGHRARLSRGLAATVGAGRAKSVIVTGTPEQVRDVARRNGLVVEKLLPLRKRLPSMWSSRMPEALRSK